MLYSTFTKFCLNIWKKKHMMWKYIAFASFSIVSNIITMLTMSNDFNADIIRVFSFLFCGKYLFTIE